MRTLFPDGRVLTMTGNVHGVTGPWLYMMWVQNQNNRFRLHAGARGAVEGFFTQAGESEAVKIREASQGRNRLVSVEHIEQGGTTLVWQSDFHEVSTFVYGTDVSLQALLPMLAPLAITDSVDGIVVRARRGTGTQVEYTLGANVVPDLGAVTVKPIEGATVQIPHSGGRAMSGGQLWRDDVLAADGSLAQRTLVLANETTASFLIPFDPEQDGLASLVESISFSLS